METRLNGGKYFVIIEMVVDTVKDNLVENLSANRKERNGSLVSL